MKTIKSLLSFSLCIQLQEYAEFISVNKQYSATDLEAFMKIAANWQNSNHNLLEGLDIKGDMTQYMNNPAMNMYKKRERTQNWNHQEKKFLLDLCRKDMRIIENKRLDAGLTAVKNKAWKIIHFKFSKQFGTDRTCNRLKEQWRRMKACTRNEILDYNNRVTRFGQEVADRKKPSPFTFEVWDFMQEAKRACKSEALDGIDYSKIPLALEEDYDYKDEEKIKFEGDEHDMDDSSRTPPQDLCDVDIKEETNETFNDNYATDSMLNGTNGERLSSSSPSHLQNGVHDLSDRVAMHSPSSASLLEQTNGHYLSHNNDLGGFPQGFNMSNISATLEAFNAIRSGQFPAAAAAAVALQNNFVAAAAAHQHQQGSDHSPSSSSHGKDDQEPPLKRARANSSNELTETEQQPLNNSNLTEEHHTIEENHSSATISPELKNFMDMQKKEHQMRMKILEIQLQTAKYTRDLTEINKTLALQKLQEYASRRLTS